jgi:CubicO group peptidase (beta-lactamase class C family)
VPQPHKYNTSDMPIPARYVTSAAVIAVFTLLPQAAADEWPTMSWPTATPRAAGLAAEALARFDSDIASGKYAYVDSMLVIRYGKVVYDRSYSREYGKIYGEQARQTSALNAHDPSGPYNYFNPWWHPYYRRGELHTLQSITKTITSIVIGAATARNEFPSLDTPVLKFFDETKVANVDQRKRRITIRHLLTMNSGLAWDERLPYDDPHNSSSLMEASADWVQYTIDQPLAHEPGSQFNYSSGNAQLLSYIFRVATGQDIEEYAAKHLFAPLAIEGFFWKRSPSGLADTEGGLYLERHDLAKIVYLFHKNGTWNGKQIVTPNWVKASLAPGPPVSEMIGAVGYGFLWWLYHYGTNDHRLAFASMGFGGQMAIVIPDYDLVIVFTGWNILGDKWLRPREAIDRVLAAVIERPAKR